MSRGLIALAVVFVAALACWGAFVSWRGQAIAEALGDMPKGFAWLLMVVWALIIGVAADAAVWAPGLTLLVLRVFWWGFL